MTDQYPTQQYYTPPPAPVQKKPSNRKLWIIPTGVGVIALFIGVAIGAGGKGSTKTDTVTKAGPTTSVTATVTTTPTQVTATQQVTSTVTITPTPAVAFTDGTQAIGADIAPGVYKTPGGSRCYFAILNSTSTEDIEDNNNFTGPTTVTLKAGKYFETDGGCAWSKVG